MKETAAGVCLREREGQIEVLLVRSSKGRWIFPKGRVKGEERGFEAAQRETIEESGWTAESGILGSLGQIEHGEERIKAYQLMHLHQTGAGEPGRDPTWVSLAELPERLQENSSDPEYRTAMLLWVDRALRRVGLR
jgi:8-oxo-dGTP pyrophosphatase MutT (NUDIX family)